MQDKKYILGLDVSTSTIGVCLFEDLGEEGKLQLLTHFEPKLNPEPETQLERYIQKANLCIDKLYVDFKHYNISRIIVEKPLLNSASQKIAKVLEMFNEYLTNKLSKLFNVQIDFITVDEARRYGLPELVSKKGTLMGDFPTKIAGLGRGEWNKFLIMYLISQRYKEVSWLLNTNLKVNTKNFDRADSIVAVLGFMQKANIWTNMDSSFWKDADLSHERCIEIVEKNIAYELFCKNEIDFNKQLKTEDKKKIKLKYLSEEFEIDKFLNIDLNP
jgi:RNase H-fold protein (predicted Holliday junction resolvase)